MTARRGSGPWAVLALAWVTSCTTSPRTEPRSAGAAAADDEALRASPPPIEPASRLKLREPYVATLANGMRLVVFERHALRIVAAELVVRGGMSGLSHGPPATARLIANTMMAGTQRRSEPQVYQAMNLNLIELAPHVGDSWFGISLRALSSRFDLALALLHDVALEPTFPADAVEVTRRRLIGQEAANADQPWLAARRNFFASVLGANHPYTVAAASSARDLERVRRDDVAQAWREMMDPTETTLVVAGDVDPLVVRQSVATLFGDWKQDPASVRAAAPGATPAPAGGPRRIIAVDRPGARQATILYGGRLPGDATARDPSRALIVELVSRAEARAKNAAAGGEPGAGWSARAHVPAFWWEKIAAPDQTRSALRELDGWLAALRAQGPDANDLKMARARVTRVLPLAFETVERVAYTHGDIVGDGLPIDWTEKFMAAAEELPWEQIRGALLQPNQMHVVVVGDLKALMDQLVSLGWGPVEVHDANGRLLRTVSP